MNWAELRIVLERIKALISIGGNPSGATVTKAHDWMPTAIIDFMVARTGEVLSAKRQMNSRAYAPFVDKSEELDRYLREHVGKMRNDKITRDSVCRPIDERIVVVDRSLLRTPSGIHPSPRSSTPDGVHAACRIEQSDNRASSQHEADRRISLSLSALSSVGASVMGVSRHAPLSSGNSCAEIRD